MDDCHARDIVGVTTTVATAAQARALARSILAARLAACVQVEPGLTSFYRWDGRDCEDAEVRLTIKTLPACEAALQALFAREHPYEVPQFVSVRLRASEAYRDWVASQCEAPS